MLDDNGAEVVDTIESGATSPKGMEGGNSTSQDGVGPALDNENGSRFGGGVREVVVMYRLSEVGEASMNRSRLTIPTKHLLIRNSWILRAPSRKRGVNSVFKQPEVSQMGKDMLGVIAETTLGPNPRGQAELRSPLWEGIKSLTGHG